MNNRSKKILVVDDEQMIRINLEAFLEDEGFAVLTAASGEEAIAILTKEPDIAVAIVDIRLSGIDGNTVIMTGYKISPKTKYILHTGSAEYALTPELMALGITNAQILYKPLIDMQALLDVLQQLLG